MSTCLGLYIEDNIIKYAKVSKEREQIKVEAFGVKFYDNLSQAIKQVVEETYSYKTPISINLSQETYNYFQIFALLNKKDVPRAIKTEFDAFCADKNYNPNVFETRYAITRETDEKSKLKVIHISANKIDLNKKIQNFSSYRLQSVVPTSMSITNISRIGEKENALIVNIEEKTTITKVINQEVNEVYELETGSQDFLDKINIKENSYPKAYEICKETTIYTSEGQDLTTEDATYLEDIMPTLYDIVGQIKKIINESIDKIEKIYITGTAALINNIDLYFEEYFENVRCEILRPAFVKISPEINIKDYVEVNSAISLALNGLGEGIQGINFKNTSFSEKLSDSLKITIGSGKDKEKGSGLGNLKSNILASDFNVPLDKIETGMIRAAIGLFILFLIYAGFTGLINKQIDQKKAQAEQSIEDTNGQIALIDQDIQTVNNKTNDYQTKITNLKEINEKIAENNRLKKSIPILLNHLMYIMPSDVQLTSIKNTTGTHIEIQAQSRSYAQLGYLTASIKTNGYLTNVISTSGQKSNNIVTIKIEGDLP